MDSFNRTSETWVLEKHTKSFKDLLFYLKIINDNKGGLTGPDIDNYTKIAKLEKRYAPRRKDSTATIKNKIGALRSYGFGALINDNSFYLGPYGDLLLKYFDSTVNIKKIVLSSLWFFQYPHHKLTTNNFSIFPFRLIFKLIRDKDLNLKLYSSEIIYFLMFIKNIDTRSYDQLKKNIIEFRNLSSDEQKNLFDQENKIGSQSNINSFSKAKYSYIDSMIKASEIKWADLTHQAQYYNMAFLDDLGIVNTTKINKEPLAQFSQTLPKAKSKTSRSLENQYYTVPEEIENFLDALSSEHPFDEDPISRDTMVSSQFILSLIGQVPAILKREINYDFPDENINIHQNELESEDLLYLGEQSKSMDDFTKYEKVIAFKIGKFKNIVAEHLGGPGKTDVECKDNEYGDKFNIDGKTTKTTLPQINPKRLENHRDKNGGKFTIVITPHFSPGALNDIENTNNTIIQTEIFIQLIDNYTKYGKLSSFTPIRTILEKNLGKDSNPDLSEHLIDSFSIKLNY